MSYLIYHNTNSVMFGGTNCICLKSSLHTHWCVGKQVGVSAVHKFQCQQSTIPTILTCEVLIVRSIIALTDVVTCGGVASA